MEDCSQIRPWLRLWARHLDTVIVALILSPFLLLLKMETLQEIPKFVGIAISAGILILAEAILLSSWGYTPGKALFRITVRKQNGEKMRFTSSLNRAFGVWFVGQGMSLPVLSIILPLMAYHRLKSRGITYWDTMGGITVQHALIGPMPFILTALLTAVAMGVTIWINLAPAFEEIILKTN